MTFALFSSTLDLGWIAGSTQPEREKDFSTSEQRALLLLAAPKGDQEKFQVPEEQDTS